MNNKSRGRAMVVVLLGVLFGGLGGIIRSFELRLCFDAQGFPIPGAVTYVLIGFTLLAALVNFLLIRSLPVPSAEGGAYAFASPGPGSAFAGIFAALLLGGCCVLRILTVFGAAGATFPLVTSFLGIFAALSIFCSVMHNHRQVGGSDAVLRLVPVFFICVWLVETFRGCSSDPIILDYIYELLAISFTALGLYYCAGFAFGYPKLRRCLFCCQMAVYFSLLTLWDAHPVYELFFFGSCALYMAATSYLLQKNA